MDVPSVSRYIHVLIMYLYNNFKFMRVGIVMVNIIRQDFFFRNFSGIDFLHHLLYVLYISKCIRNEHKLMNRAWKCVKAAESFCCCFEQAVIKDDCGSVSLAGICSTYIGRMSVSEQVKSKPAYGLVFKLLELPSTLSRVSTMPLQRRGVLPVASVNSASSSISHICARLFVMLAVKIPFSAAYRK